MKFWSLRPFMEDQAKPKTSDPGVVQLCLWSLRYAIRRKWRMAAVLGTMLFNTGLEVIKPWPMVILIDYVLKGLERPPALNRVLEWLPGARPSISTGEMLRSEIARGTVLGKKTTAVIAAGGCTSITSATGKMVAPPTPSI